MRYCSVQSSLVRSHCIQEWVAFDADKMRAMQEMAKTPKFEGFARFGGPHSLSTNSLIWSLP